MKIDEVVLAARGKIPRILIAMFALFNISQMNEKEIFTAYNLYNLTTQKYQQLMEPSSWKIKVSKTWILDTDSDAQIQGHLQ